MSRLIKIAQRMMFDCVTAGTWRLHQIQVQQALKISLYLTSIKAIHYVKISPSLITYSGKQNITPSIPQILSSPLGSLSLSLSLTVNPFFTSTKSATQFPPSPLCNNRPSSSHFSIFLCMIHFQAKLNASLTVSPLDWTFITTFSYGNFLMVWFLLPFTISNFRVFNILFLFFLVIVLCCAVEVYVWRCR